MAGPRTDRNLARAAALSTDRRSSSTRARRGHSHGLDDARKPRAQSVAVDASQLERTAHRLRPLGANESVPAVECERDSLQTESDPRRMRHISIGRLDVEQLTEMILMVVERDDRGRG